MGRGQHGRTRRPTGQPTALPQLRPAPVITRAPLQLSPAEVAVRLAEREAVLAADALRAAVEEWQALDRSDAPPSARQAMAADVDRAHQRADGLLQRALDARLDLDVPIVSGAAAPTPPGTVGAGVPGDRFDVVSWNHPEWSWEQLMAAALDEPVATAPEPGGAPAPTPDAPAGMSDSPEDELPTRVDGGRSAMVVRGTAGQIARSAPSGVPLDTGRRTAPDEASGPRVDHPQ